MFFNIFKRKKKKAAKEAEALKKSQEIIQPEVPQPPPEPEPPKPEIPETDLMGEAIHSRPDLEEETPKAPEVSQAPMEAEESSAPEQVDPPEQPVTTEPEQPAEEAVEAGVVPLEENPLDEELPSEPEPKPEAESDSAPAPEKADTETQTEAPLSIAPWEEEMHATEPRTEKIAEKPPEAAEPTAIVDTEKEVADTPEPLEAPVQAQDLDTPEEPEETESGEPFVEPEERQGFFSRLKSGLAKTRQVFSSDVDSLFKSGKPITEELFDELEEMLVTSDMGMTVAMDMMERIRAKAKKLSYAEELRAVLKEEIFGLFPEEPEQETEPVHTKPHVIMVVGVNGTGKTTTLGKLATRFTREGKRVLLVAADTFRAAAIDQLEIWADRSESEIVKHREGADPAAVAYDGIAAAVARKVDIVIVDTAGRLHTQKNLMEELKKIKRTVAKKMKGAPHEVLMVLDATTGQNAISQARIFNEAVGLTQLALTKLDGTAKGGIAAAVAGAMNLPIKYIGVGEGIEDLQDFDARKFIDAIFED